MGHNATNGQVIIGYDTAAERSTHKEEDAHDVGGIA